MTILSDENFTKEVIEFKGIVFVDFWSHECPPCLELMPKIKELGEEYECKNVKICSIDIDYNIETAKKYDIIGIPTLVFFKNGEEILTFYNDEIDMELVRYKLEELL